MALDPHSSEANFNLGSIYCYYGQCDEAVAYLEKAVSLDPGLPLAYNNLGVAYDRTSKYQDAARAFTRAIRLDPSSPLTLTNFLRFKAIQYGLRDGAAQRVKPRLWLTGKDIANPVTISSHQITLGGESDLTLLPSFISPPSEATIMERPGTDALVDRIMTGVDGSPHESNITLEPTEVYLVGPGDILDIRQMNRPTNKSTLYTVLSSGEIEYTPASLPGVVVAGLTANQIADKINSMLERQEPAFHPETVVSIREYASHTVVISGLVEDPGEKVIQREAIPLYVLLGAAVPKEQGGSAEIKCLEEGRTRTVLLSDEAAMKELIHPGDEVRVTERPPQYYYITGQVRSPGQKSFHQGITLTQAIIAAGGSLFAGARVAELIRENGAGSLSTRQYKLRELTEGKISDPQLQSGDRIEVR